MTWTVEAVYENGVLKPKYPLPLKDHETVTLTVSAPTSLDPEPGVIPCTDPRLIEWAALDPELEYPRSPEEP